MTQSPSKSTPDFSNGQPTNGLTSRTQDVDRQMSDRGLSPGTAKQGSYDPTIVLPDPRPGGRSQRWSKFRFPLRNSIGSKLFISVLGAALLGVGGMSLLFYLALEDRAEGEIQSSLGTKARAIENELTKADRTGSGVATAVKALSDRKITEPEVYRELMFDFFLERSPLTMGVGFSQTANGVVPDRQWFGPYFYVDQNVEGQTGEALPAPYDDIRYAELFADDNYPQQDYYKQAVARQQAAWSEPYQWYGIAMTTLTSPIVNITAIGEQVREPVLRDAGYYAIISEEGNLLAFPPDPEKAKNLETYADVPELQEIWSQLQQNDTGLIANRGTYWAYERIAGTDWLMLAAVPRSVVIGPVLLITVGGALGAGLILAVMIALFVQKLNRRLQPILSECYSFAQIDPDDSTQILNRDGADELEVLEQSFHHMTMQLRRSFSTLEDANRDLEKRVEERTAELLQAKEISEQEKQALQTSALRLLQEVDPISRGNLTIRAKVTEDEIGTIADSYNATVENLCKIVLQVQEAVDHVVSTTGYNETSVRQLSAEAARQAAEITVALEQIQQMADALRVVSANALQAEVVVQEAAQTVEEGDMAINRTVEGMQSIRATVAETAKKVKHLGESSQKISTVIDLINAFAAQTNMLALNASIEASRAGEYGKGFAVVAEEVRTLARQSAEATEEIRKLVVSIQAETNDVVKAMEAGTEQVVLGTKLVDDTRQSLSRITATSAQITELVSAIAQATTVQTQASEIVTNTMQDVAAIANQTSTEAQSVSSSFGELRQVAETLQSEVSRFRV
jgi:methyl-accepting chemotaxis protein